LLNDKWIKYWSMKNGSVIPAFNSLPLEEQKVLITEFVRHHVPGWPEGKHCAFYLFHYSSRLLLRACTCEPYSADLVLLCTYDVFMINYLLRIKV